MKYFLTILLLFTTVLFAGERMQKRQAIKERSEINKIDDLRITYCQGFNARGGSGPQSWCLSAIDSSVKDKIKSSISGLVTDSVRDKANDDLNAEVKLELCVTKLQAEFDICGWSYAGNENCSQMRVAKKANGICTPVGSGSGSGSGE